MAAPNPSLSLYCSVLWVVQWWRSADTRLACTSGSCAACWCGLPWVELRLSRRQGTYAGCVRNCPNASCGFTADECQLPWHLSFTGVARLLEIEGRFSWWQLVYQLKFVSCFNFLNILTLPEESPLAQWELNKNCRLRTLKLWKTLVVNLFCGLCLMFYVATSKCCWFSKNTSLLACLQNK